VVETNRRHVIESEIEVRVARQCEATNRAVQGGFSDTKCYVWVRNQNLGWRMKSTRRYTDGIPPPKRLLSRIGR
jgi:hypothetical protein